GARPLVEQGHEGGQVAVEDGDAADQHGVAAAGLELVPAQAADEDRSGGAALDLVVAVAADDNRRPAAGLDLVVAVTAEDQAGVCDVLLDLDLVVAGPAEHDDAADVRGDRLLGLELVPSDFHLEPVSFPLDLDLVVPGRAADE